MVMRMVDPGGASISVDESGSGELSDCW